MRILITGSRDWDDVDAIWGALDGFAATARELGEQIVVVHGGARGADLVADRWVRARRGDGWPVFPERHNADWVRYGKRAGFLRNKQMVDAGAYVCLAFINLCTSSQCQQVELHGSHGASSCAELAERAGIPTIPIRRFLPASASAE